MSESTEYYYDEMTNFTDCRYMGTEHVEGKIYLIGVFATLIAILSIIFNTFFTVVFIRNKSIRQSSVFYFGVLAVIDTIMAINYIALMSLPVYMDFYHYLPMYHLFLSYCRLAVAESSCAIFASMLLILLATSERLLCTFEGKAELKSRRFLERNRPAVCSFCILLAVLYKICTYWEIDVMWKPECEGWGQYEIVSGPLTIHENYRFWWMFITRNVVDRILPFFLLVAMNYLIIRALKKEHKRHDPKQLIIEQNGISTKIMRRSVKDATRALISIVSMYLMSQSLQVLLTFWETFDRASLEEMEVVYSYMNDIVSIMTLLSSSLRFPVYCCCNHLIYSASSQTLSELLNTLCIGRKQQTNVFDSGTVSDPLQQPNLSSDEPAHVGGAVYNEELKEWQL